MKSIADINFGHDGLIPAIAQDINTSEVLTLAYMNKEALEKTLWSGKAHYWSRSRKKLWLKGETSGNFQEVKTIYYDCDADALLLMVDPAGPACHTGEKTCFYRVLSGEEVHPPMGPGVIKELYAVLKERKGADPEKSYVASLYSKGDEKILEKVAEESREFIEAATEKDRKEIVHELADLWFHTMVLLSHKDIELEEVFGEFSRRFGASGIEEKRKRKKK